MKCITIAIFTFLMSILFSQTYIPAGDVSGIWTCENSPYYIFGEIEIPNGEILILEPGIIVEFQGHYKLNVQGRLLAEGTEQDSILFTAQNHNIGWHGIRFHYTSATNDSSRFNHCRIEYGKAIGSNYNPDSQGGAIYVKSFHKVMIKNSIICNNYADFYGGGLCFYDSNANISNCIIKNNVSSSIGGGMLGASHNGISSIFLYGNKIHNNFATQGGGVDLWPDNSSLINNYICNNEAINSGGGVRVLSSEAYFENNIICNNNADYGGGLNLRSGDKTLINNTICNNSANEGGGIYFSNNGSNFIENCLITGNYAENGSQIYSGDGSELSIRYCILGEGLFNGNINSIYENSFNETPSFLDPSEGAGADYDGINADWSMQSHSLCINSGNPESINNSINDIVGNRRIFDERIDIGAYEFQNNPILNCSFKAVIKSGAVPLTTQFYSICNKPSMNYEWDFDHDDIIDSEEEHLIWTFLDEGVYTVSLITSNQLEQRTEIKENYISVTSSDSLTGNITNDLIINNEQIHVVGDVLIMNGITLTILPGTTIVFDSNFKLNIQGRILAEGTETDSIYFTVADTTGFSNPDILNGGWGGIRFENTPSTNDSSFFDHCNFEYGKALGENEYDENGMGGALFINSNFGVKVSNSRFINNRSSSNGGAIYISNNGKIRNCEFRLNYSGRDGGAIYSSSNALIDDCIIINNIAYEYGGGICSGASQIKRTIITYNSAITGGGGGVEVYGYSNPKIINTIISNNSSYLPGGAIRVMASSQTEVINSLICNNDNHGIYAFECSPKVTTTDIVNNIGCGHLYDEEPDWPMITDKIPRDMVIQQNSENDKDKNRNNRVLFNNSIVWGNSQGENWIGNTYHLENADPMFVSPSSGQGIEFNGLDADWSLLEESMLINYGTIDTTGLNLPEYDLDGNPRIFQGETARIDIGSYEYQGELQRPYIEINTDQILFGYWQLDDEIDEEMFVMFNRGSINIDIYSIDIPEGFQIRKPNEDWTDEINNIEIQPDYFQFIYIRFHPDEIEEYNGFITFETNDEINNPEIHVNGVAVESLLRVSGPIIDTDVVWDSEYVLLDGSIYSYNNIITIMPGSKIIWKNSDVNLKSRINAIGTESDSIIFTSSPYQLRGKLSIRNLSVVEYCIIENSISTGIILGENSAGSNDSYYIDNSLIQNNRGVGIKATLFSSTFEVENSIIKGNSAGGFWGNGLINRCHLYENSGDYVIKQGSYISSLSIYNSLINNNTHGLQLLSCGKFLNCSFVNNDSGEIFLDNVNHSTEILNSIFYNDSSYENITMEIDTGYYYDTYIKNCIFQGGLENIVINGDEGNLIFINNFNIDPQFINSSESDYHFQQNSICIDNGLHSYLELVNPCDLDHNARVWDGDNDNIATIDIGCYEFGAPVSSDDILIEPIANFKLHQNYPNPFNPSTAIKFDIPKESKIELTVFNIKGQKVKNLIQNRIELGNHEIVWNGTDDNDNPIASGIYFYQLRINEQIYSTKKCLLLK